MNKRSRRTFRTVLGFTGAALVLAVGVAGQASAAATFLVCGYQASDGTSWEKRYVYPATRQCPASSSQNGKTGQLVYSEIVQW